MNWFVRNKKLLLILGAAIILVLLCYMLVMKAARVPLLVGAARDTVYTMEGKSMATSTVKNSLNITNQQLYTGQKRPQNVNVGLLVKDAEEAYQKVVGLCENMNGYEASANMNLEGGRRYINVTLKLPPENITELRTKIKEIGKVTNFTISTDDISEQYVDTESRIRNMKNTEAQLNQLMKRSDNIKDLLEVQNQLYKMREELEVLEGRIRVWNKLATESTVSVTITEKEQNKSVDNVEFKPLSFQTLKTYSANGFISMLNFFINLGTWVVVAIATLLPLIILALVVIAVIALIRFAGRNKGNKTLNQ